MSDRRDVDGSRTERPAAVLPTVSEVLALDAFAPGAPVVVVGGAALEAPVRWVHVSDSADVARLLEGGELLLSTGSGWPDDPRRLAHFVAQLAEVGAAGIVLELGAHYRYVPAVLADAARSADIALIVLHREVKFVTITEAVHRRIIADQTAALEARDAVRTLFTGLALRGAPTEFIVEQVGLTLAAPVVLESVGHEVVVAHVGGATETRTLRDWARRSRAAAAAPDREGRAIVPVEARGIRWGWLVALPGAAHLAGRDAVLEQAATALALGRLADPGGEEWSRLGRRRVVDALIDGRFTGLSAVAARLDAAGMPLVGTVAFAAVALVSSGRGGDAVAAAADIAAAAIGARVVCGTSTTLDDGSALVRTPLILAVAGRATSAADNRADAFTVALEDALRAGSTSARARVVLGPGTVIPALEPAAAYERAVGTLVAGLRETIDLVGADDSLRGASRRGADGRRVAERPLTRVVAALRDDHRLVAHAERMLDPLLAETRARGGDLLDVLTALLAHPSNRTAAAEAAHLSRSVFYQRIALLEDLLGVDFDDGEQVAALHVAVLTHRLHAGG
ncbi:PucR family transcriptional regulator ligand-binding domain-containing protein [Microbacterium sp. MRS-1]|uniref:PucR family transcriptional regulator ligand-binding domain-containing protein n=1 Tax=Microbacterium sp. MRS-1 TaxID=1451261 RepID=UPI0004B0A067|nr:PucR family transcriptional regulator ligand-binding domain-containing protein [Microbacterium sp. MRS-1]